MRKFRVHYNLMIGGEIHHQTKCVSANNAHDAKSLVSRNLFQRGVLHAISPQYYVFPGTFPGPAHS